MWQHRTMVAAGPLHLVQSSLTCSRCARQRAVAAAAAAARGIAVNAIIGAGQQAHIPGCLLHKQNGAMP
jgi:ornithine cyclodeaminase/alanine dehydrogenase-like protein (mu-crystallin family)